MITTEHVKLFSHRTKLAISQKNMMYKSAVEFQFLFDN